MLLRSLFLVSLAVSGSGCAATDDSIDSIEQNGGGGSPTYYCHDLPKGELRDQCNMNVPRLACSVSTQTVLAPGLAVTYPALAPYIADSSPGAALTLLGSRLDAKAVEIGASRVQDYVNDFALEKNFLPNGAVSETFGRWMVAGSGMFATYDPPRIDWLEFVFDKGTSKTARLRLRVKERFGPGVTTDIRYLDFVDLELVCKDVSTVS